MPDVLPVLESVLEVLTRLTPALSQIPEQSLIPIRAKHHRVWEQCSELEARFKPLLSRLDRELSPSRAQEVRTAYQELFDYARAFYAAELQIGDNSIEMRTPEHHDLAAALKDDDAKLTRWAKLLLADDPDEGPAVRRFTASRGRRDTADDVLGFCAIFGRVWPKLESRRFVEALAADGITPESLKAMSVKASRFIELENKPSRTKLKRLLRHQAYTALDQRYRTLVQVGRMLSPGETWPLLGPARSRPKH